MLGKNNASNNQPKKLYLIKDGVTQDFTNLPLTITTYNSKPTDKTGYVVFSNNGYYIQKDDLFNYRVCCRYIINAYQSAIDKLFGISYSGVYGSGNDNVNIFARTYNVKDKITTMSAQTENYQQVAVYSRNSDETRVYDLWLEKSKDNE